MKPIASRLLAAACISCLLLSSPSAGATPPAGVDAVVWNKALTLAQITQPRDVAIANVLGPLSRSQVEKMLQDPEFKELESQHPGMVRAMWAGARPLVEEAFASHLSELWNRLAEVYATNLKPAEMDDITAFFASPTGKKYLRLTSRPFDPATDVDPAQETAAQHERLVASVRAEAERAFLSLSKAEQAEVLKYYDSPGRASLERESPEIMRAIATWTSMTASRDKDGIAAAMVAAGERFVSQERRRPHP